jgi:hypothetical protein
VTGPDLGDCVRKVNSNQAVNLVTDPHGYEPGSTLCGQIWEDGFPTINPCGWYDIISSC